MLRLTLALAIICFLALSQCNHQPKDEVEIIPQAAEKERKKVKLFWSIMYEVCRSFCVWRAFCRHFCEVFNPDQEPDLGMDFPLKSAASLTSSSDNTVWLYTIVSKICENDATCIEKCLNMEVDDEDEEELWQAKERPANVLRALYELTKSYAIECAKINNKPTTVVDSFTVDEFCREITSAGREFKQHCLNLLT